MRQAIKQTLSEGKNIPATAGAEKTFRLRISDLATRNADHRKQSSANSERCSRDCGASASAAVERAKKKNDMIFINV